MSAFNQLDPDDRDLVQALVLDDVTEQEYADLLGVTHTAVHKRKHKILTKLSKILGC